MLRVILFSIISTITLVAAPRPQPFHRPLVFEPNRGQAAPEVKWIAHASSYQLWLTSDGVTIMLPERPSETAQNGPTPTSFKLASPPANPPQPTYSTVRMKLNGSRAWNEITGLEPTGGTSNYFFGDDPEDWHTNIPQYARLNAAGVYDGIDLVFYSHGDDLEYDFVVAPGADPKQIRLAFEGVDGMRVDGKSGDLLLTTAGGSELRHIRPKVYQQAGACKIEVAGGYEILDRGQAAFALAAYDRKRPVVIDPTISFTRFLAGSDGDVASAIAVDSSGNSYVTGYTFSTNFPVTNGSRPCRDHRKVPNPPSAHVFVTKLSSSGTILFSTYLSGCSLDLGHDIAVDSTGVYVTGFAGDGFFPTLHPFQLNNGPDAFVTKLSLDGSHLIYSSFLGGPSIDDGYGIAVDSAHAAYVVGITYADGFPTVNALQWQFGGVRDGFVAKVDPSGAFVAYATYLGGSDYDDAEGIAVDSAGSAYVTGVTASSNFPIKSPSERYPGGSSQCAFVTKLTPQGNGLVYSTYLGGGLESQASIAIDASRNAYVTGSTSSPNFPTISGAFQKNKPTPYPSNSAFVTKLSSSGGFLYSSYFGGGNGDTFGNHVAINRAGEIYVVGATSSTSLPGAPAITPNPTAGFLVKLAPQLNAFSYTVFLGAQINGVAILQPASRLGIALLNAPQIYTTGWRYVPGSNVSDPKNTDAFVVKLDETPVLTSTQ